MKNMSEDNLKALVMGELRNSLAYNSSRLASARTNALNYYLAKPVGDLSPPEIPGRSTVVSTDVRDTIEWMMPQLMSTFCGGDTVVEFEATKPEDDKNAEIATEYINYLFFKKNKGHKVTYTWMKDALLQRNGIIKVWWDNSHIEKKEEYRGIDKFGIAKLLDDPEIEITEQMSYPDDDAAKQIQQQLAQMQEQMTQAEQAAMQGNQQAQQALPQMQQQFMQAQSQPIPMLYDVTCKRTMKGGKVCISNVPPEEFFICRDAIDIQSARYTAHGSKRTRSDLRSMGFKNVEQIGTDDPGQNNSLERINRRSWNDEQAYSNDEILPNEDEQKVWVFECYMRVDYDGDGISELRKITVAGNTILENEEVDQVPFISITPVPLCHTFFGLSIYDLAQESQKTKTNIVRAMQDNMYLSVNGRYYAVEGQVNVDDLLMSRPGGVVRIKNPGAVGRLDQGQGNSSDAMGMLEYAQTELENRTGWTRYSQGNDPSGLKQNTAEGMNIITNKADMRLDLIARVFADGFEELFSMMLKLVCQYQTKREQVKLSGGWMEIDPREWTNQFNVNINVGLGMGNKGQRVQHLMMLAAQQEKAFQIGVANPEKVYALYSELAKQLGFKNGDKFFVNPVNNPPPPPQPNPEQIKAQAQMQVEQAKIQAQMQLEQMKVEAEKEIEQAKAQLQAQVDQNRQEQEARQHALKIQTETDANLQLAQIDADLKRQQIEMDKYKADLDSQTQIYIEQMRLGMKVQETQLNLQADMQKHADAREDAAMYKQIEREDDARESANDSQQGE